MLHLFIEKDIESKGGGKSKRESVKILYVWNILTKDRIYCSYLKWICSSSEKYYKKKPDEYLRNYKMKIHLSLLLWM